MAKLEYVLLTKIKLETQMPFTTVATFLHKYVMFQND
jgi:hypothetical protein